MNNILRESERDHFIPVDKQNYGSMSWTSVDNLTFTSQGQEPAMVLAFRKSDPHKGELVIPGSVVHAHDGDINGTASRAVREKLESDLTSPPCQVFVLSDRNRDERGHTISIVTAGVVESQGSGVSVTHGDLLPSTMPFGHIGIISRGCEILSRRMLVEKETALALFPGEVTVTDIYKMAELVTSFTDSELPSQAAISKQVERSGVFTKAGTRQSSVGRPAVTWKVNR